MIAAEELSRPITDLIDTVGTGALGAGGADTQMRGAARGIGSAMQTGVTAAGAIGSQWQGADAEACGCTASAAARAGGDLVARGEGIASVVTDAAGTVSRGVGELTGILESFLAVAACQGPALFTPVGQIAVVAAAVEHVEQAMAVFARMRGEMEVHAGAMAEFVPPVELPPVPSADLVSQASSLLSGNGGVAEDVRSRAAGAWEGIKGDIDGFFEATGAADGSADAGADSGPSVHQDECPPGCECPRCGGGGPDGGVAAAGGAGQVDAGGAATASAGLDGGVAVQLPDGSTVNAPNPQAAGAVQAALSQRGVPYSWGGEAPGQALDCSGLTQWAYGQEGVDLPRLAQAQTVGTPVTADQIAPGDLAVWDGHVAMVVGDGRMVEAGDPVQVNPVRTTNGGMAFQGFYRPTEG